MPALRTAGVIELQRPSFTPEGFAKCTLVHGYLVSAAEVGWVEPASVTIPWEREPTDQSKSSSFRGRGVHCGDCGNGSSCAAVVWPFSISR